MYPRGHAGLSMVICAPFAAYFTGVLDFSMFIIISMWSSILPDIDVPICRRFQNVRHRGITHTIWFVIFCTFMIAATHLILSQWLFFSLDVSVVAVIIGITSHIVVDGFNRDGVKPFEFLGTWSYHLQLSVVKSDSWIINNLLMTVGVTVVFTIVLIRV